MSEPVTFEDAFRTIAVDYRKKNKQKNFRMILGCGTIPALFILGAVFVLVIAIVCQKFSLLNVVPVLLMCGMFPCFFIYLMMMEKRWDQERLTMCREDPESFVCANELEKYGFYELALEKYDKCLEKQFEESRKRADELSRFFKEFSEQTQFVDEFPRPVPRFVNHDLGEFDSLLAGRIACLLKLGRKNEAKTATAQRAVIEKIENEGKGLTEKFWEIKEEED